MKPRRVILTIELETDISAKDLKLAAKDFFDGVSTFLTGILKLVQIQVNVIKKEQK